MAVIRVTKEFTLEMAHALEGHDGACRRLHGHSYRLWVTVRGEPLGGGSPKQGMVVDFGDLKRIVEEKIISRYDHSLVIRLTPENGEMIAELAAYYGNVIAVSWQPTSENLVSMFAESIRDEFPAGVTLYSVRLSETATSYAEWTEEDQL